MKIRVDRNLEPTPHELALKKSIKDLSDHYTKRNFSLVVNLVAASACCHPSKKRRDALVKIIDAVRDDLVRRLDASQRAGNCKDAFSAFCENSNGVSSPSIPEMLLLINEFMDDEIERTISDETIP